MKRLWHIIVIIYENLTEPHPAITREKHRLEAKLVAFMVIVMIGGVTLNLIFGSGLTPVSLFALVIGYIFSRTKYYKIATYLIICILLVSLVSSIYATHDYNNFAIFSNIAWLTLSLLFASLLLSIKETILISVFHIIVILLLSVFTPEIDLKAIGVSFGFISVFSTLLIITMWRRNELENARQKKIREQATHDLVTGLPNRILFHDRLDQAIARIQRNKTIGAILYLDLDDFKDINDEYSHEVGDQVLKVIADRILSCIRITDTGARISGDEFVILLEDVGKPENAAIVAQNILDAISSRIAINGSETMVSGSIGIAMIPRDGMKNEELLQNADTAMYSAKAEGKHSISFFTAEMKEKMLRNISLSKSLHKAIDNQEFHIEFQPQFDVHTGNIFGAEALLRWRHPAEGLISPYEFIPIAEKTGLIFPLSEWVIENVLDFHQVVKKTTSKKVRLAVNLSSRQLREVNFPDSIESLLEGSEIDPACLELEITENSIFDNFDQTVKVMKKLKSLGVRLAIDDFGTGYSSLSYLETFPVDTIKIDTSFLQKITHPDVKLPILSGIITIATEMGLDVIAEGVENDTQLQFLKNAGCSMAQGFYFNASLERDDFLCLLKD